MWSIPLNPRGSYMGYLIPPSRPQFSPSLACIRTITAVSQLVPRLQPHPVSGFLLATGKVAFIQHRSVHVTSLQRILQPLLPDRCRALSRLSCSPNPSKFDHKTPLFAPGAFTEASYPHTFVFTVPFPWNALLFSLGH